MEKTTRTQELKTIDINGGVYVKIAERIRFLADNFDYSIETESQFIEPLNAWKVKATLKIEEGEGFQTYTGTAVEKIGANEINITSALENAETSAVGRACAFAGIGLTDDIASAEEVSNAKEAEKTERATRRRTNVDKSVNDTLKKLKDKKNE